MSKVKIGVLGASRGMDYVNRVLLRYEYAEIFAICESYPVLCEKARETLEKEGKNVLCFTEYEEFLASGVEAVILCNYANEHVEYAIQALKRGIHVLSESLPTETMADAVRLCEAVEESGCIYAYAESYCYFNSTFEAMKLYESGVIGEAAYIEGTFINDCSPKWHMLTRGERNHWRNYVPSTFYCTHSIGPMLYATGLRSIRINGFEVPRLDYMAEVGARSGSAAMEVLELTNGGVARSMNGNYRHPYTKWYRIIGTKGSITADWDEVTLCTYENGGYQSKTYQVGAHDFPYRPQGDFGEIGNADLMVMGYFVGAILGDEESKKRSIDVYRALDMSMPGLLAYRSILDGGMPYKVPDFRNKEEREAYRNDSFSTNPAAEEDYLLPTSKSGTPDVDEAVYDAVKAKFHAAHLRPGMN